MHAYLWVIMCGREKKPEGARATAFMTKEEKAVTSILLCVKLMKLNHVKLYTCVYICVYKRKVIARKVILYIVAHETGRK